MKRFVYVGSLLVLILFFTVPVFAQMKIGYINSARILTEFKDAIEVDQKLQRESEKMAGDINRMRVQIDSLLADYEKKQLIYSREKKAEVEGRLQTMYADVQKAQQDKFGENGEFEKLRIQLLNPILEKIDKVIKELGQEGTYDFIFDARQGNIVYADEDKYDITDLVLERLK
ncbi:OmpH family outer membrane protein [candidate division KSB1 bacterium]